MDENMFDLGLDVASLLAGPVPEPIITLSGGDDYTVPDAADYPLLALSLYGKSTQGYASRGGTPLGKNLSDNRLNFSQNLTSYQVSNGVMTVVGGTNVWSGAAITLSNTLIIGQTYTVSFNITGMTSGLIQISDAGQGWQPVWNSHIKQWDKPNDGKLSFTFTAKTNMAIISVNLTLGHDSVLTSAITVNLTNIQLELGSTATEYEPYYSNPNPDCPVPIESFWNNGLDLVVKGEGDIQVVSWRTQGEIITQQPLSAVCKVGDTVKFNVKGGTSYQWQQDTTGTGVYVDISTVSGRSSSFPITGKTFRNGYKYRCVVTDSSGNSEISNPATLYVMDEDWRGTSGSILALALDTPLRSVGDYHDSREYTYNGEIKGVKRIVELNKPTVNSVSTYTTPEGDTAYRISLVREPGLLPNVELLCNILAYNSNWNTLYTLCAPTEIIRFQLPLSELEDGSKEAAQSWVNEHNMTIYYPLAEPGGFELSPEEVESLSSLRSYEETTNIYNNAQVEMFVRVLRREFDMKYVEWLKESQTWVCPKSGKWKVIAVGGGASGNIIGAIPTPAITGNGGTTSFGSIISALGGVVLNEILGTSGEVDSRLVFSSGENGYDGISYGGSAAINSDSLVGSGRARFSSQGRGYGASGGSTKTGVSYTYTSTSDTRDGSIDLHAFTAPCGGVESTIVDLEEGQNIICTIGKGGNPTVDSENLLSVVQSMQPSHKMTKINTPHEEILSHISPGKDGVIIVQYLGY